jgi:hypothetical protein
LREVTLQADWRSNASNPERRVLGLGASWAIMARPMAMIVATMPSIGSVDLSLAGLRLPAGSWATARRWSRWRRCAGRRGNGELPARPRRALLCGSLR